MVSIPGASDLGKVVQEPLMEAHIENPAVPEAEREPEMPVQRPYQGIIEAQQEPRSAAKIMAAILDPLIS